MTSSDTGPSTPILKPGVQTTEFWLTLIAVVSGALATAFADAGWAKGLGAVAAALSALGYTSLRSGLKERQL